MAMTMTGEATLPAARPKVWALLNDPDVLKACIPGCQSLERVGDNGFAAVAKIKIGPVSATFRGKVEFSDIVPDVGYTIAGEGEGGVAGFAKGGAKVSLADAEGGTLLRYAVEAHVGGQDRPARLAPDRRRRQGHGRQVLRQFRRRPPTRVASAEEARAHPAHAEAHVTHHFSAAEPHAGLGPPIKSAPIPAEPQAAMERAPAPVKPQPFAGSASGPAARPAALAPAPAARPFPCSPGRRPRRSKFPHPRRNHGSGGFGNGSRLDDRQRPARLGRDRSAERCSSSSCATICG